MDSKKNRPLNSFNQQKSSFVRINPGEENLTIDEIVEKRIRDWKNNPSSTQESPFWTDLGQKTSMLRLNNLGLKQFPNSLRTIPNIENIDLGSNEIEELPKWIGEFKELIGINLADNKLKAIPSDISQLKNLKILPLNNNDLEFLPIELQEIEFKTFFLAGNHKLGIPESILSNSPQAILRYYFESRAHDGSPLLELKLLLVGRGKSGKTTLIKQLSGERPNKNEPETHSISIREFKIKCPKGDIQTRAWDFGGQEILHSTHQFFLTERSLYLLVLEPRTELAYKDAEYWLKLIESQGNGSPVIIALNWSHNNKWKIDEVKLKRKFPFIVDFISTDALVGEGIEELRDVIVQTVQDKMSGVWLPFPKHWRNIKNEVSTMSANFLTYKQYVELCETYGEKRPDAQADLAEILHSLGLALYFGKDPRLHDTRVLNPGWVTGGVYAVIRSGLIKSNDGQLYLSDMNEVLKSAQKQKLIHVSDYPVSTYSFILELMRAFQLCYASEEENGKPTRYLIPELLSEFEPEMNDPWNEAEVRLRYKYNVFPSGLLPRFIVQTHALSEGEPHWKHGVVLKHADAQALIIVDQERSELQVSILGNDIETRSVLVAIIRREIELLHSSMKLQPIEELELSGETNHWISVKSLKEIENLSTKIQRLPVQPEGIADVNVPLELDKLVPEEARMLDRTKVTNSVKLFVCYAREDEKQLKRLDAMLDILEQQHGLRSWIDKRLIAGEEWDDEIKKRLEEMDIFLFVASQNSLVRKYIRDTELKRAKERRILKDVEILTVKLEPCACDEDEYLGKLQRLGAKYKSVAETSPRSIAWEQIRKDLIPVIKRIKDKKKHMPSTTDSEEKKSQNYQRH